MYDHSQNFLRHMRLSNLCCRWLRKQPFYWLITYCNGTRKTLQERNFKRVLALETCENLLLYRFPICAIISACSENYPTMNQLLTDLTEGSVEYKDNGEVIRHPPTATMLRAARAIKQLLEQDAGNMRVAHQLQQQNQQLLQELENVRNEYTKLSAERNVSADQDKSVRTDEGETEKPSETVDVGS